MKRTLYKLTAFIIVPVVYYLIASGYISNEFKTSGSRNILQSSLSPAVYVNPVDKDFSNCIFNLDYFGMGTNSGASWSIKRHLTNYKYGLNFNSIHIYGGDQGGKFDDALSIYKDDVNGLMGDIDTAGLRGFYGRQKIERLCYGQRLVYEAEGGNNGFSYQTRNGDIIPDGNRTVLYACAGNNCSNQWDAAPRVLAGDIYENLQHSDVLDAGLYGDPGTWFMKPVMRIDSSVVDNHPDWPVVTVQVFKFGESSTPIKSIEIKAKHFAQDLGGTLYGGQYIDIYNFIQDPQFNLEISGSTDGGLNEGWDERLGNYCHVDFKIYWHGLVDVWLDKVVVDDVMANRLFSTNDDAKVIDEVNEFYVNNSHSSLYTFFADELLYSNILCAKRVQELIKTASNNGAMLSCAVTNYHNVRGLRNPAIFYNVFFTELQPERFQADAHELSAGYVPADVQSLGNQDIHIPGSWYISSPAYNTRIQQVSFGDKYTIPVEKPQGSLIYQINKARTDADTYLPGTKFIMQPQIHGFLFDNNQDGYYDAGVREPLNEEIEAQAMIAIAHGADGLCWFQYQSFSSDQPVLERLQGAGMTSENPANRTLYCLGMLTVYPDDNDPDPRHINSYGQDKWDYVSGMNRKINTWKPTLDAITWQSGWSIHSEHSTGAFSSYIQDIQSIKPGGSGFNPCPLDGPLPYSDCPGEQYWEMGFFNDPGKLNTRYLMMVNRRCVPENSSNYTPDNRILRLKFNGSQLPGSLTNWVISEVGNSARGKEFPRSYTGYLDIGTTAGTMGWFSPGEGKLFKIMPAVQSGGTLVADEVIEGENFTCEAPVYNNGHNITIGANTTIHFNDSSKFVMDSGSFTMGSPEVSGSQSITSDAVNGNSWHGYSFNNCEVRIYGAAFGGLTNDTTYAINIIDCPVVDIRNSTFTTNASLKGGINGVYYSTSDIDNIYIGGNTFTSTGSSLPQVQFMSYAGITTPLLIENNTFNYGSTAILLSGVTGGAIKDNNITDYNIAINLLSSGVDISDNNIVSSLTDAIGIFGASGSEIKMNNSGSKRLGGANDISTTGPASNNIKVDNSFFLLDQGENIFNINEPDAYHLGGFFNAYASVMTEATENCFKFSSSFIDPPYNNVTWGDQGLAVTFTFSPYLTGCIPADCENPVIVDLGHGIYDTICGDDGGGQGSNIPLLGGVTAAGGRGGLLTLNSKKHIRGGFIIQTPKQMYDSLSILMRHRNYPQAKVKCYDILNAYPDSLQSIYTISKLFLATIGSDTTTNTAQQLKTYYEGLILNHPNNTALITRANYFIQKCKVRLRDYNSALTGFSQIINQNPYSYEALVARWDYMAASLLINGGSGGESSIEDFGFEISDLEDDNPQSAFRDPNSGDDKSPYTKQERQDIRKSINTALENTGRNDERKMKILEESGRKGDKNAMKELNQRKTIKEVVKTERPRTIIEHTRIVAGDIRKVFGTGNSGRNGISGNIPTVFRLSQNYPNPFNPTTKINYDLPKDAKVNIVIYDILGREVKRLLNNEIRAAGSYVVDFNASIYASGVYFYRIEAEESNGNKFVDSKKMVLIK